MWWKEPIAYLSDMLHDAQERGELGDAPVPPRVTNLGVVLVTDQCVLSGVAPAADDVAEIVNVIWMPLLVAASTNSTN